MKINIVSVLLSTWTVSRRLRAGWYQISTLPRCVPYFEFCSPRQKVIMGQISFSTYLFLRIGNALYSSMKAIKDQ